MLLVVVRGKRSEGNRLAGKIPNPFFALICGLEHYDLANNPDLSTRTLAGHLACNFTNLKQRSEIKVLCQGLTGTLPSGLGRLKSLTYLALDCNALSGAVRRFARGSCDRR